MSSNSQTIPKNHMVIAEDTFFDLDCYKTKLNNNVLVVGAAGSGKTRSIVIPNILNSSGSYIISDPKGNLYYQYRRILEAKGYRVKHLNFDNPDQSIGYNFFDYIHSEQDLVKIANMLIYSTEGKTSSIKQDPYWDRMGEIFLISLMAFLWLYRPKEEQTLNNVLKLAECVEMNENLTNQKTVLDKLFEDVSKEDPESFALRYYKRFNSAAIRTKQCIVSEIFSHLGRYNTRQMQTLLERDETDIARIGHEKTAFFVQVSDTDRTMDDLANVFFTQAMQELCNEADYNCENSRLPVDVRFILDDFATNCHIHEFPRMISAVRSRGISTMLMIQAESQLVAGYDSDASTIIGNCDTYVYLGCNDIETAQSVSKRCNQSLEKTLYLPLETCWIFRRGQQPICRHIFSFDDHIEELKTSGINKKKPEKRPKQEFSHFGPEHKKPNYSSNDSLFASYNKPLLNIVGDMLHENDENEKNAADILEYLTAEEIEQLLSDDFELDDFLIDDDDSIPKSLDNED